MSDLEGAASDEATEAAVEAAVPDTTDATALDALEPASPVEGDSAEGEPSPEAATVPTAHAVGERSKAEEPAPSEASESESTPVETSPEASDGPPGASAPATVEASAPEADPEPSRRLQCVLSIRRAVAWAGRQDKGAPHLQYIGAASLRLLESVDDTSDLADLKQALEAIDGAPVRSRRRLLGRARRAADDLLGPLAPQRRKRRPRPAKDAPETTAPAPEVSATGADAAKHTAEAPVSSAEAGASTTVAEPEADDRKGRTVRKRRRSRRRGGAPEPVEQPTEAPVQEAPKPPPEPKLLPLGHPDGTGRSLSALECLDTDELEALAEAGVDTIAALLQRAPSSHVRTTRASIAGIALDEPLTVRGPIQWRVVHVSPHGRRWEVGLGEEGAPPLRVRWFRRAPRGWDFWEVGQELGVHGEAREAEAGVTMYEAEPLGLNGRGSGLLPCYGIDGVDDATIRDAIALALQSIEGALADWLPSSIREHHRLLALEEALRDAHFPANTTGRGRLRLAFDELFTIQVGVAWRSGRGKPARGIAHKPVHTGIGQVEAQHQIRLDDAQELAFSEIRRDLVRPVPMSRLLQGDVGSGKGLVAQMAALMVVGGGCQAAMVSPDSLAAERRYLHIDPILRSIGIKTMLVTEDHLDRAQIDAIRRGEAQIVFGTRAILQKAVTWKRLGLVTVEERGPYGSLDMEALARRGTRPDLLVIPRAPIPSSLAFTVFGDFDVSTLHAAPHRPVQCEVFANADRQEAYASLREVIEAGRQGYVVFPVRDGRDLLSVEDAMRTASALRTNLLPGARIGVYSSEMSRDERGRIFEDFQHRRIDVLVCTTYIEDSPAVTNATAMVIEYADMHDLVRLHRLRAHVSGGYKAGSCAFVASESVDAAQSERLEQLVRERDGFRLAELDLRFRGASALLGSRATEAPSFAWADPPEDRGLFMRARAAAFDLIRKDPELRTAPGVASTVNLRWSDWLGQALPKVAAKKKGEGRRRRRKRR